MRNKQRQNDVSLQVQDRHIEQYGGHLRRIHTTVDPEYFVFYFYFFIHLLSNNISKNNIRI